MFFILVADAHAYIDPGSGSLLLQMLVAGVVGAIFYLKKYFSLAISFFSRINKPRHKPDE
jgi:hypothetical protein